MNPPDVVVFDAFGTLFDVGSVDAALEILSADAVRVYKPDPRVYALVATGLRVPVGRALFVSSNSWDVAGAIAFGLQCAWVNRGHAAPEALGPSPAREGESVARLAEDLSVL